MALEELMAKASELAGRPIDVQQTKDGQYIVLYMCFGKKPPPKGATPDEALTRFIDYIRAERPIDAGSDTDLKELRESLADQT